MKLDELKTKYSGKKISAIEKVADSAFSQSVEGRKSFILALYYLERTSRFKENKIYTKASFDSYIRDRFNLLPHNYHAERKAFIAHPVEVKALGIGDVVKVMKKCGPLKVPQVLEAVKKASEGRKSPLPREKRHEIYKKFAKPVPKKPKAKTAKAVQSDLDRALDTIKHQNKTITAQVAQIEKLKIAVTDYKDKYWSILNATAPIFSVNKNIKDDYIGLDA